MVLRRDLRVPHQGNLTTSECLTLRGDLFKLEINQAHTKKPREIMEHRKFPKVSEIPTTYWPCTQHQAAGPREGRGNSLETSPQTGAPKPTSRLLLLHLTTGIAPQTKCARPSQEVGHCPFQKLLHLGTRVCPWLKPNSNSHAKRKCIISCN